MIGDQTILFVLFGVVFGLLLWGRWRYDVVAFGALLAAVVLGVVPADDAFSGFGHPATVIVALVLAVSRGLVVSGVVGLVTRHVAAGARGLGGHIAMLGGIGAVLSAFMNNVAALALLMPVDVATARKAKRNPALSLMPLSFATILGGMVTLIGTPPNILVASYRETALGEPFAMFDFAPVGLACAAVGLGFVALAGWRLIPVREGQAGPVEELAERSVYIAELVVPEGSPAVGRRVIQLDPEADGSGVAVLGIMRGRRRLYGSPAGREVQSGDALLVEGDAEGIEEFRTALGLGFDGEARRGRLAAGEGEGMIEVVVPEGSEIAGRSALGIQLLRRYGVVLLGISRRGTRIRGRVRREVVEPGDVLLLLGPTDRVTEVALLLGTLPLAERGLMVTQDRRTLFATGVFAAAVLAASVGLVYLPVALGIVVVVYAVAGILRPAELYQHIEWPVVVLLGSMIPLGQALETSGGTALIAGGIVAAAGDWPAWAILAVVMAVTMTMSDVLNNTATAIIAAPIAIDTARALGANPDTFLMAVAVAASCAFLTPIGHKNNTLILGPGGYRFGDYWRMGLPLEILIVATGVPALLVFWPL